MNIVLLDACRHHVRHPIGCSGGFLVSKNPLPLGMGSVNEYLRLKNYGVSVKEMNALLQHSPDGAFDILNTKVEQLEEQIEHMQAVVDEQRRLYTWYQARREHPLEWEITQTEPYLFLFHRLYQGSRDLCHSQRLACLATCREIGPLSLCS